MITLTRGNLLEAEVDAIVNTVNTVGVMGKGIALQFKKAFPENFRIYKKACDSGEVEPGRVLVVENHELSGNPRYIVNFPTKRHWRGKSRLEDIETGLVDLARQIIKLDIKSIALPPLGCGNGGLLWSEVLPRIEDTFSRLPEVDVQVFEPSATSSPRPIINRTQRPKMTPGRAAILCLMNRYSVPGYPYRLSMLEIQKLAYFMQVAGQHLRLNYQKHFYGPYADNLRKVLERIDGHFIDGYGDGVGANKPETPITLFRSAAREAEKFLQHEADTQARFDSVAQLIEGYETAYGMELLSTVHWVANREMSKPVDTEELVQTVHNWNMRKKDMMKPQHIRSAWETLVRYGWV